jgi:hypothetical protein
MSKRKEPRFKLTKSGLADWLVFGKNFNDLVFKVAERYFKKAHGNLFDYDRLTTPDELRLHSDKIRVQAYDSRELQGEVEIPLDLLLDPDWESRVDKWTEIEKAKQARSKRIRSLIWLQNLVKEFPDDAKLIVQGKEPIF